MGDHRLDVKIHLVGMGGEVAKIDWRANWWPDKPELLYRELVQKARKVGLDVEDKTYLMSDGDGPETPQAAPVCAPQQQQLWIACVQDRHLDPEASIHLTREAAIEHARDYMREHVERPDKLRERDSGDRWDMTYEYESDFAFVVRAW